MIRTHYKINSPQRCSFLKEIPLNQEAKCNWLKFLGMLEFRKSLFKEKRLFFDILLVYIKMHFDIVIHLYNWRRVSYHKFLVDIWFWLSMWSSGTNSSVFERFVREKSKKKVAPDKVATWHIQSVIARQKLFTIYQILRCY